MLPLLSWLLFLHLHPTMYLLIRCCVNYARVKHYDLHPTMYLLIPLSVISIDKTGFTFTSHYVSINSVDCCDALNVISTFTSHYVSINSPTPERTCDTKVNLHPTMYLLIQMILPEKLSEKDNLHPTMYLLILTKSDHANGTKKFTSHYVSINSSRARTSYLLPRYLHPTMYLLIPGQDADNRTLQ